MKKRILSLLLAMLMVVTLVPVSAFAADDVVAYKVTGGNIYFDASRGIITGCDNSVTAAAIPSTINGVAVTSMDWYAFSGCTGLTSVTIPGSMKGISVCAFSGCTGLKDVKISNGVTFIGGSAFQRCTSLTSINIPASVTLVVPNAFHVCDSLTSIKVADANTSYSSVDGVLLNKDKTELVKYPAGKTDVSYAIPNSVTCIDEDAFSNCKGLKSITIPNSVTSIGESAFAGCNSLKSITIPNGVTSIGGGMFSSCESLTDVTIPNSVTSIGNSAFSGCDSLKSIAIPNSVTSIGEGAFAGCDSLKSITIPNGVTSIERWVFEYCESLESITIPDSVTSIGDKAFGECHSLTSVTIPSSVTSIGQWAFSECHSLTSVTIPSSVTSIWDGAFYDCWRLTSINVADANTVYSSVDGVLFNKDKTELIQYPIGKTEVSYMIPNGVTSIDAFAFRKCKSLSSVIIPNSVKSIGYQAFWNCISLTSVTIPDSVTSIDFYAFCNCAKLTSINVANTNMAYSSVDGVLFNKDKTEIIQYPNGKTDSYYTIPNSVKSIGTGAFEDCKGLANVIIADSVTNIGWGAFSDCKRFTDIIIPNSVTSVDKYAFADCTSLKIITLPSSVTSIGWGTFNGCTSLTDVYYFGTKEQWNKIAIETTNGSNKPLINAKIHYSSVGPVDPIDPVTPSGFIDVPSDAFYANAVKWAVENEITTGVGNNRFDPNGQCTRGQVVTFLWRAAGKPTVSANVSFSDVQPGAFYYEAVKWAVANGITQGVGGNRFAPNDTCTRGQVVTFLHRAENSPAASTISSFTDVPSTAFYYNAVNWAVANGITNGTGNGRFSPNDTCTRAQVVTFLYRAQ